MASQFDTPSYVGNKRIGRAMPVYSGMPSLLADPLKQTAANLGSAAKGELPPDVQNLLAQRAAEIGVGSGTWGSDFNRFRSLRDLGLTSLQRQDFATQQLMPHFMTPYQSSVIGQNQLQINNAENQAYQNRVAMQQGAQRPINNETSAPVYMPPPSRV